MSDTDISTIPNTPASFSDVTSPDVSNVFAWLRPHSLTACAAFDGVVNTVILKPAKYEHVRQFLHTDGRVDRASSVFSEEDGIAQDSPPQWIGAYKFSLNSPPQDPSNGWMLGTNRGREDNRIDMLLAPSGKAWTRTGISSWHARLFLHPESYRMTIEARHTVTTTKHGAHVLNNLRNGVLEHGELLEIGSCSYIFEYTDLYRAAVFEQDLCRYMKLHIRETNWSMNDYLSPCSVGMPLSMGKYYSSASAFAQGTFGKVSAGWTRDGSAVAIKTFKNPKEADIVVHTQVMDFIGRHVRRHPLYIGSSP